MTIEVASRLKYSNWLYQQGAGSPLFPGVTGGMLLQKILEFQSTNKRFLAFRGLEWAQKSLFSIQENLAETSTQILIYWPHNQLLQAMNKW